MQYFKAIRSELDKLYLQYNTIIIKNNEEDKQKELNRYFNRIEKQDIAKFDLI